MSGCCRCGTRAAESRIRPRRRRLGAWGKLGAVVLESPPGPGGGRPAVRLHFPCPDARTKLWRKRGRNAGREGEFLARGKLHAGTHNPQTHCTRSHNCQVHAAHHHSSHRHSAHSLSTRHTDQAHAEDRNVQSQARGHGSLRQACPALK